MNKNIYKEINDKDFEMNNEVLYQTLDYRKNYQRKQLPKLSEQKINLIIKEIKEYLKNYNYSEELKEYLILIITSMIEEYGNFDIIDEALKSCEIYFENETTKNLAYDYGIYDLDDTYDGVSLINPPTNLWENQKLIIPKKEILVGYLNTPPIETLDSLTHEFRHIIASLRNTNYYETKNIFVQRIGLSRFESVKDLNELVHVNNEIDEGFNTSFTQDLVNNILTYKNINIEDNKIKELLQTIKNPYKSGNYYSQSYILEQQLLKPLIDNVEIYNQIKKETIYGNISILNISKISNLLDNLMDELEDYDSLVDDNNYKRLNHIENKINTYKQKVLERSI